jgi:hypothetical protein
MPTVSRFVVWETPAESCETYSALARLLAEAGIESPSALQGQEPSLKKLPLRQIVLLTLIRV